MPRRDYEKMIVKKDNGGRLERFIFNVLHVDRGNDSTNGDHPDFLVLLNSNNSGIIEAKIENDPNYITFTKYLVKLFRSENGGSFPFNDEKKVLAVVRMIDVENSTNVWRFNREGLKRMVSYIVDNHTTFLGSLLNTEDEKRCELVESLIAAVNTGGPDTKKTEPRSLASKVCKYLAQYLYSKRDENDKDDDNYYINDSFVRKTLPYYCAYYGVTIGDRKDYSTNYKHLFKVLDDIRENAANIHDNGQKLTRGQMDHIMWYCYKNSGNDDEFERIRIKVPTIDKVDKLLIAFVNLYGVIDVSEAFGLIHNEYEDYEFQTFNSDLRNVRISSSNYYRIEDGKIFLLDLTPDTLNRLIDLHNVIDLDFWSGSTRGYNSTTYQEKKSISIMNSIVRALPQQRRDLNIAEAAEGIRKALFEDFLEAEDLIAKIRDLIGDRLTETRIKSLIKNNLKLPVLKGHTLSELD